MLDRRRRAKGYGAVPQEGDDIEMGPQETGVTEDVVEESSQGAGGGEAEAEGNGTGGQK